MTEIRLLAGDGRWPLLDGVSPFPLWSPSVTSEVLSDNSLCPSVPTATTVMSVNSLCPSVPTATTVTSYVVLARNVPQLYTTSIYSMP